jgi:hypothetical protein
VDLQIPPRKTQLVKNSCKRAETSSIAEATPKLDRAA